MTAGTERHAVAAGVIASVERNGTFTFDAWRRLNAVVDDLHHDDLAAVMQAIIRSKSGKLASGGVLTATGAFLTV